MTKISVAWKPEIVLLSYTLSILGCLVGVHLSEQFRLCTSSGKGLIGGNQILLLMAISIGGVGVWAMHFIGMGAVSLMDVSTGEIVPMSYDIGLTMASLISVVGCVYLGLMIATRDRVFEKNADTVGEMLISDAQGLSLQQVKNKSALHALAIFKGLQPLALGGVVTGTGVSIMHYIGMMSQDTGLSMSWNAGIVFASVLIAVVVSTIAFWIMFRLLSLYPKYEALRVASALVMGVAVCGMHYTGMNGATFYRTDDKPKAESISVDQASASTACIVAGLFFSVIILVTIISDLRVSLRKEARQMQRLLKVLENIQGISPEVAQCLLKFKPGADSTNNRPNMVTKADSARGFFNEIAMVVRGSISVRSQIYTQQRKDSAICNSQSSRDPRPSLRLSRKISVKPLLPQSQSQTTPNGEKTDNLV
eukprot:gene10549-21991_t